MVVKLQAIENDTHYPEEARAIAKRVRTSTADKAELTAAGVTGTEDAR